MIQIPIINVPNQSLSIQLDNNQWDISIHSTQDNADSSTGIMAIDITINNNIIISGVRAMDSFPLIPYQYLIIGGNITFITQDDEYPDWRQFGITQYLIYASDEELEEIENGTFQS
jgi:hypothetical protein